MRDLARTMQVAFTYVGTVVGAGFATGQEILQFFTRYGWMATWTIGAASLLFVWLGTKIMMLSADIRAVSYEDLNKALFGKKVGGWISTFTLIMLFGVTSVMLAGAGSLFEEHLGLSFQVGLAGTLLLTYLLLHKGMDAILAVNSIVVPIMLAFTVMVVYTTSHMPGSDRWLRLTGDSSLWAVWFSPILYASYNLAMAQAVLVPLGSTIQKKGILWKGGLLGGIIIGLMLLACHYALSAQMPGITQFEIPMGHLIEPMGRTVQLLYLLVIFSEIFTTYLSNVFGLALQLEERTGIRRSALILLILLATYLVSQVGFSRLLAVLYPLFGAISLIWCLLMLKRGRRTRPRKT